jgi:ketosteroid isomerase-like protein
MTISIRPVHHGSWVRKIELKARLVVILLILAAASNSFAVLQSDTLITRTLRPQSDVPLCHEDICGGGEMLRLSKLLLSKQGMIEVQGQLGLFIVTDQRENVESIAQLFEAYHEPNSSPSISRTETALGAKDSEATAIRGVLDAQAAAWNRGDVEGYMDGYDRSPKTEFVGGDSITRGWQQVLDRYKQKYDTREKMGTLTFTDLEINILSSDAALVLGRWRLKRANDEPHGTFTLLFRKTKAGWRIVHDHSSSA